MADLQVGEYGSWVSPISSDLVTQKSISLKEVRVDPLDEGKATRNDYKRSANSAFKTMTTLTAIKSL